MRVQIVRGNNKTVVTGPKVVIRVFPAATLVNVGDSHYPVLHGGTVVITDDNDLSDVLVESPSGPKSKYKQAKLDL